MSMKNTQNNQTLCSTWGPYAELVRLNRPLGYLLNTCPYIVGIVYSAAISPRHIPVSVQLHRAIILTSWSLIQRWAGCAWNDTIDQDLDRQIIRTKSRPIPRGAISTSNAILFTTFLFSCGFSLILMFLPIQCVTEACIILFFALLYPFGKKFSNYPQLTLANIGWAIPMSMHSMDVNPLIHLPPTICMFMFIAIVIIMVDVLYARQDLDEDMKVGVKSMAVHFRDSIWTLIYRLFFGSTTMLIAAGGLAGFGLPFFLLSVGGHFFGFLVLLKTSEQEPSSRMEWYAKSSLLVAMTLWVLGLIMEQYIDF